MKRLELLGIKIPMRDKEILRQIADMNKITMSDVARMLITDGIENIADRDLLKVIRQK
jgi:hypothetical protein